MLKSLLILLESLLIFQNLAQEVIVLSRGGHGSMKAPNERFCRGKEIKGKAHKGIFKQKTNKTSNISFSGACKSVQRALLYSALIQR